MKGFFKVLKLCVCVVIIASLVLSFVSCKNDAEREYEEKLSELLYEKQRLINEKEKILYYMKNGLGNTSFMSLAFVELDSALYTEVYPMMAKQNEGDVELVGVIAFSEDELPGLEGKITLDEYNTLMLLGWGNAIYWNGQGDLDSFISRIQTLLLPLGIDLPHSLLFADGTYSPQYDELLISYGIENAVHNGEEGLELIETSKPGGVWHPGKIGWKRSGSKGFKETLEEGLGYALFEIGFDNSEDKHETTFFPIEGKAGEDDRIAAFERMIGLFKQSISDGVIAVCNIDDTRESVKLYYENLEAAEADGEPRLVKIEADIADVQRRITELYNQYN